MRLIFFFSNHWKFSVDSKNAKKSEEKIYGFSDSLIQVGNGKLSLLIPEYSQLGPTCYQAVLKSQIQLKITLSNSIWPKRTKKSEKSSFLQISGVFASCSQVHCERVSETSSVMHLTKHISCSLQLQKYLSYEAHFLFQNIGNLFQISKMQKNVAKNLRFFRQFDLSW